MLFIILVALAIGSYAVEIFMVIDMAKLFPETIVNCGEQCEPGKPLFNTNFGLGTAFLLFGSLSFCAYTKR